MGFLDFLLTAQQKKEKIATQIGLESGLFVMCPVCHGVTESRNPAAYQDKTDALVQQLIRAGDPRVEPFKRDEAALQETLAKVARQLPYHCTCESI